MLAITKFPKKYILLCGVIAFATVVGASRLSAFTLRNIVYSAKPAVSAATMVDAANQVKNILLPRIVDSAFTLKVIDDTQAASSQTASNVLTGTCAVTLNVADLRSPYGLRVQTVTGWDARSYAIYLAGHELQHCQVAYDMHAALTTGEPLTFQQALALQASVDADLNVIQLGRAPNGDASVARFNALSQQLAEVQLGERIGDVTGLLMVQQLTKEGLSLQAVEGLAEMRHAAVRHQDFAHDTASVLYLLSAQLRRDAQYGRQWSREQITQTAYSLTLQTKEPLAQHGLSVTQLQQVRLH